MQKTGKEDPKGVADQALEALQEADHMMCALADGLHEHPYLEAEPVFNKIRKTVAKLRFFIMSGRRDAVNKNAERWCKLEKLIAEETPEMEISIQRKDAEKPWHFIWCNGRNYDAQTLAEVIDKINE